jgi:hypothetical protein
MYLVDLHPLSWLGVSYTYEIINFNQRKSYIVNQMTKNVQQHIFNVL